MVYAILKMQKWLADIMIKIELWAKLNYSEKFGLKGRQWLENMVSWNIICLPLILYLLFCISHSFPPTLSFKKGNLPINNPAHDTWAFPRFCKKIKNSYKFTRWKMNEEYLLFFLLVFEALERYLSQEYLESNLN